MGSDPIHNDFSDNLIDRGTQADRSIVGNGFGALYHGNKNNVGFVKVLRDVPVRDSFLNFVLD